jgi:hypothetical protein
MNPKALLKTVCLVLGTVGIANPSFALVTFSFDGWIQYQQSGDVPGLRISDQFHGSYTFDPRTIGQPFTPYDNTLDTAYWAVTAWSVSIPATGLNLSGTTGEIGVGNNAPWYLSDRYIATLFPGDSNPIIIAGHAFSFFQIDIFDFGNDVGADMLQSSALPLTPPDLNLVPDYDQTGRFVFSDASYQNRMTEIVLVPEPSALLMSGMGTCLLLGWGKRKYVRIGNIHGQTREFPPGHSDWQHQD